jgi:hypothetical protein
VAGPDEGRVDLELMRRLYDQAREALTRVPPGERKVTLRAVAEIDRNFHMVGRAGRFRLESDENRDRGGEEQGPSPLQYFLAATAF